MAAHIDSAMYLLSIALPTPLTVEEPSDDFVALRDYLDCRNALTLSCFQPPVIHEPFGDHTVQECRERLKLNRPRVRVWGGLEEPGM